jgi:hypothetical protein
MRHFLKIAQGVDTTPLLLALYRQPGLWNLHRLRTTHPGTPHTDVDDIWLRFQDLTVFQQTGEPASVIDQHESIWYPAAAALPEARPLIFGLMARVEGERLGRVLITSLAPGRRIAPHVDGGAHAAYFERFHCLLQCPPEALFRAGEEIVSMAPGEVWWFDNSQEHEVWNDGDTDRLTLIVDIRCTTGVLPCR